MTADVMNGRPLSRIGEESNPSSPCSDVSVNSQLHVAGIRRSAVLPHSALTQFNTQTSTEDGCSGGTLSSQTDGDVQSTATADDDAEPSTKPVIRDVKLVSRELSDAAGAGYMTVSRYGTARRQRTLLRRAKLEPGHRTSDDSCLTVLSSPRPSSTFTDLPLQSNVYIELGDYQTLLRPMKHVPQQQSRDDVEEQRHNNDDDDVLTRTSDASQQTDPSSPSWYGEDTLRAMAVITQKYDSFKRRQQRVCSFLAARVSRSVSRDSTSASDDVTTVTSARSTPAAVAAMSFRRRLAAQHAITLSPPPDDVIPQVTGGGHVTEAEVERVRLFYSSVDSEVVVCASLADVSVGCVARRPGADRSEEGRGLAGCDSVTGCCWIHLLTGVPVLVLSVGSQRRRRELSLVVADRCTALPLWRDRINCMSAFRHLQAVCDENNAAGSGAALTMRVSGGLTKRLRIDVFSRCAAAELMAAYAALTADPADDLWNMSNESSATAAAHKRQVLGVGGDVGQRHAKSSARVSAVSADAPVRRAGRTNKPLTPRDVSLPCEPRWITRVDAADVNFRSAFADYLAPASCSTSAPDTAAADVPDEFRPRLPTN